jgi:hypothetical protein
VQDTVHIWDKGFYSNTPAYALYVAVEMSRWIDVYTQDEWLNLFLPDNVQQQSMANNYLYYNGNQQDRPDPLMTSVNLCLYLHQIMSSAACAYAVVPCAEWDDRGQPTAQYVCLFRIDQMMKQGLLKYGAAQDRRGLPNNGGGGLALPNNQAQAQLGMQAQAQLPYHANTGNGNQLQVYNDSTSINQRKDWRLYLDDVKKRFLYK